MIPSSSWPARLSFLALALHSVSVVNADDHLKPRSVWSRRHRDSEIVRRQAPAGGVVADLPSITPLALVGEATSVDPATVPSSTSNSSTASSSSTSEASSTTTFADIPNLSEILASLTASASSTSDVTSDSSTSTSDASSASPEASGSTIALSSSSDAVSSESVSTSASETTSSSASVIVSIPLSSEPVTTTEVSSTVSASEAVSSAPTSTPEVSSTSVDTAISSSTTDGGILSSIISIISSVVDPSPSSTTEPPVSSTTEPSISSTTEPSISSTTDVSTISSDTDVPTISSTTDGTISSTTSGDGGVITDPSTSSTITSFVSSSTSVPIISSSSDILSLNISSFLPGKSSTIDTEDLSTISSTSSISVSIRSEFNYLTASSLDIESITTTSTSVTITDPDAPTTSVSSGTQSGGIVTATVSSVPIPTNVPQFIKPSDQSDPVAPESDPEGYTLVTILFQKELGWTRVLSKSDIAGAIMAYIPALVTAILDLNEDDVKLVGLKAYAGPDYQSSQNLDDIQTMLLFYLTSDQVQTLKSYYATSGSVFYTTGNTVTKQLTGLVVKTYSIAATVDTNTGTENSANNSTATKIDNGRRNAIIGVCVAFGAIALGVFIWWMIKTRQQRRESAHRRLSYQSAPNYGTTGAAPVMAERGYNNGGAGGRRNSFYAFGQDNDSLEDETFDYMSQNSHGGSGGHGNGARRHVAGQPISQPILRETSMGHW